MKITSLKPKHLLLITLLVLLASYSIFQARFLILGPRLWIESPRDGEVVAESLIVIRGRAENVAWIDLNGRQIFTDEHGEWSEKLIVSEGTSIMTVSARDRFGREIKKSVRIVLN